MLFGVSPIGTHATSLGKSLFSAHLEKEPLWSRIIPSGVRKEKATHHGQQGQQPGQTQDHTNHLWKPFRGQVDGAHSLQWLRAGRRGFWQLATDLTPNEGLGHQTIYDKTHYSLSSPLTGYRKVMQNKKEQTALITASQGSLSPVLPMSGTMRSCRLRVNVMHKARGKNNPITYRMRRQNKYRKSWRWARRKGSRMRSQRRLRMTTSGRTSTRGKKEEQMRKYVASATRTVHIISMAWKQAFSIWSRERAGCWREGYRQHKTSWKTEGRMHTYSGTCIMLTAWDQAKLSFDYRGVLITQVWCNIVSFSF